MWRNSPHDMLSSGKFLHMINVEKLCHMEKFLHMRNVETNLSSGKFLHMRKVEKICHVEKFLSPAYLSSPELICHLLQHHKINDMYSFFYVLSQFTPFCREYNVVAIYALWRGEKLGQKFCLWRKKDKYQVWH